MKKTSSKVAVIVVLMIIAVVAYYGYLSNKTRTQQQEASMTVVQETLSRDLSKDYPPTPKEVVKYYNEIVRCFYNEECSEDEIEELGTQARGLYDRELLDNNEMVTYLDNLKTDVEEFKANKRRINNISLASSTNVDFFTEDGYEFARIMCTYSIADEGVSKLSSHMYLLRQDEEKKWKIYGWDLAENLNPGSSSSETGNK